MDILKIKNIALFVGGALAGTVGVKLLSCKDAKKVYVKGTAAVLRAKDCVMETAEKVQANAEDILAEAKYINDERAAREAACFDDANFNEANVKDVNCDDVSFDDVKECTSDSKEN